MRLLGVSIALAGAIFLSACLPVTSKTAAGTTAGLGGDLALLGGWQGAGKDSAEGIIVFLKNDDGSLTAVVTSKEDHGAAGSWQRFLVRTASLGGRTFLNAREIETDGKIAEDGLAGANIPVLYKAGAKTLVLNLLDEKKVADAIRSGSLAGAVEPGEYGDVEITADGGSLDALLGSDKALALFGTKPIVLRRIF